MDPFKNELNVAAYNWMNESGVIDFLDKMAEADKKRPRFLGGTLALWIATFVTAGIAGFMIYDVFLRQRI